MTNNNLDQDKRRYKLIGAVCLLVVIFIGRLFYLQIISDEYKGHADGNAFFHKILYPPRGNISDRNNKLIVYNQPTFDVVYIPREVQAFDTLDFCNTLGITKERFQKRISEIKDRKLNPGYSVYTMQTFITQLSMEDSGLLQEKLYKFPGFFIQKRTVRQYNYPNAGLLLGYVAEVNRNQINEDEDKYYIRGDYAGKSGIELSHEKTLRGEKGVEILLRDVRGRIQGKYKDGKLDKEPIPGKNLTLSIDMELQAFGEQLMQNKTGAIVMIEPSTGEVLCLVSAPTYDPSLLLNREFSKNFKELEGNPYKPLFNRAIQGRYPPGSTFKTTQALTFLEEGIITTSTAYSCFRGYPPLGGRPKCHGHGSPLAIEPAIATSCNSFFCYGLTAMLHNKKKYGSVPEAFEVWKNHMVEMGFGYKLGVDLPSENRGFIPNSTFYSKAFKNENWKAANVISIAIGQGEVLATPLQVANLAATIANRGYYYVPHVVKKIENAPLDTLFTKKNYTGVKEVHYKTVVEGMARAVTGGTCRGINLLPEIEVCGKTGTAENPHGKDHSMFMGFAPRDNPKVAIFVIIENSGFGATYAVPAARLMIQKYLKGELPSGQQSLATSFSNTTILPNNYVSRMKKKKDESSNTSVEN